MIKLLPNDKQAQLHFFDVKPLIQKRISGILAKGLERDGVRRSPSGTFRHYLNSLLNDVNLRQLIVASPQDLLNIITNLRATWAAFFDPESEENFILRNIFISHCYNSKYFDKLSFIQRIELDTCPYCNRNYIYYLTKKSEIKPQIDHFYPKSTYPFLAASFYNLIPSCQTCNGFGAKEERDPIVDRLIHPYLCDESCFKFTYKIKSIDFLNPFVDKGSVEVKFRNCLPGHLSVFKLDKLYAQHSDHVIELIVKSKYEYSPRYRQYLRETYPKLRLKEHEIDRMILGNYASASEIHKRPLAKLYQDIGRELGLIK